MHHQTKRAIDRLKRSGLAEKVLLESEDANEFYDLCDELLLEFSPCGPAQEECLWSIAIPLWRKLHSHTPIVVQQQYVTVPHAMALYKAGRNGVALEEAQEEIGLGKTLGSADEKANHAAVLSDPKALKRQDELVVELDAQISHAIKQMVRLKQLNNTIV